MCVCVRMFEYVCMYVCMYVYMQVCMYVCIYTHSISIRTAHYWNALSDDVVRIVPEHSFVHCLPYLVLKSFVRGRTLM